MHRLPFASGGRLVSPALVMPVILTVGNVLFNVIANSSFKLSSQGRSWREFLLWQVVGNLSGFIGVLIFTFLLRYLPLHVAFPLIQGLAIIGIQVVAASWLFHEAISPAHWVGTALIIFGILILGSR